jgi:hypothetical protein
VPHNNTAGTSASHAVDEDNQNMIQRCDSSVSSGSFQEVLTWVNETAIPYDAGTSAAQVVDEDNQNMVQRCESSVSSGSFQEVLTWVNEQGISGAALDGAWSGSDVATSVPRWRASTPPRPAGHNPHGDALARKVSAAFATAEDARVAARGAAATRRVARVQQSNANAEAKAEVEMQAQAGAIAAVVPKASAFTSASAGVRGEAKRTNLLEREAIDASMAAAEIAVCLCQAVHSFCA